MKQSIDCQVHSEALFEFGRAPSSAKEPIDVGSEHGAAVIQTKQRIKATAFELPLADNAAPAALGGLMNASGEVSFYIRSVVRVFV